MIKAVYILCALTSFACTVMLVRGHRQFPTKLLYYTALCFAGLAINNIILYIDLAILPLETDLSILRNTVGLLSSSTLLYGLIVDE